MSFYGLLIVTLFLTAILGVGTVTNESIYLNSMQSSYTYLHETILAQAYGVKSI